MLWSVWQRTGEWKRLFAVVVGEKWAREWVWSLEECVCVWTRGGEVGVCVCVWRRRDGTGRGVNCVSYCKWFKHRKVREHVTTYLGTHISVDRKKGAGERWRKESTWEGHRRRRMDDERETGQRNVRANGCYRKIQFDWSKYSSNEVRSKVEQNTSVPSCRKLILRLSLICKNKFETENIKTHCADKELRFWSYKHTSRARQESVCV